MTGRALDLPRIDRKEFQVEWRRQAACVGMDPLIFFPGMGRNATEAKRICAECPVRLECLTYAVEYRLPGGVFGGKTEDERRAWARGATR